MNHLTCGPTWKTNHYSPFGSLIDQFFSNSVPAAGSAQTLLPRTDVAEHPEHFEISIDLPGMEKGDIDIVIHDGTLTVSGERKIERKVENDKYTRMERSYGEFKRSFRLPENVDGDSVNAEYKNGVLTLEIRKLEEALPKKIEVTVR